MNDPTLTIVETQNINDILVHGYYYAKEAWFTRTEIGQTLEYADPEDAIKHIHQRHRERLDLFSRGCQFVTPSGKQYGIVYNTQGVFEICRWSTQPKANMVMDALYEMAETVMRKGYFSLMSDSELIEFLKERAKVHPETMDVIGGTKLKKLMQQEKIEQRSDKTEQIKQLWIRRFANKEDVNIFQELKTICSGDTALFHKYLDKYHADERKEQKGNIVTFQISD